MTLDLATLNLILDIVLKLVLLLVLGGVMVLLKNLDELVSSAERSAESFESTAETIDSVVSLARMLPMVGGRKDDK